MILSQKGIPHNEHKLLAGNQNVFWFGSNWFRPH
jgi:hypothetical protein